MPSTAAPAWALRIDCMEIQYFHSHQEPTMELQSARQIIDTLARGIHPDTGEAMPPDSPYNAPAVIRALHVVSRALETPAETTAGGPRPRPAAPANAGKPWAPEDDAVL